MLFALSYCSAFAAQRLRRLIFTQLSLREKSYMEGGRFELPNPKERIYSPPRLATSLPLHERKKLNMAEEEGFEPPRALTPLSVFKTDPFSRTWVFLRVVGCILIDIDIINLSA
jgi:hypothetical protein